MADGVGEIDGPIVEGPLSDVECNSCAEREVGGLVRLERGLDLIRKLRLGIEDQLHLLALGLEGGNGLLTAASSWGWPLLHHHEVGGAGAVAPS